MKELSLWSNGSQAAPLSGKVELGLAAERSHKPLLCLQKLSIYPALAVAQCYISSPEFSLLG